MTLVRVRCKLVYNSDSTLVEITTKIPSTSQYILSFISSYIQGMIALRRGATEVGHEDYMDGKLHVINFIVVFGTQYL